MWAHKVVLRKMSTCEGHLCVCLLSAESRIRALLRELGALLILCQMPGRCSVLCSVRR